MDQLIFASLVEGVDNEGADAGRDDVEPISCVTIFSGANGDWETTAHPVDAQSAERDKVLYSTHTVHDEDLDDFNNKQGYTWYIELWITNQRVK